MNWLAHLYLAAHDDDALLGALLGDFVRGSSGLDAWGAIAETEIHLHRRIDAFTDAHPQVLALREGFAPGRRRYAGIVLDVHFDHLLARDWDRWRGAQAATDMPLDAFTARAYRVLDARFDALPPRLQAIAPRMAGDDWLGSYRERASVDRAVMRMSQRLSRDGERMVEALDDLRALDARTERTFSLFFPALIDFARDERRRMAAPRSA
ncbi:MAG TPA: ACP phosphodiesterase [Lysobacter sp.]